MLCKWYQGGMMSEGRFRVCCDDDLGDMWVVDIDTDEEYWTAPSLVDLLNELVKENEQLRKENERQENEIKLLRKAYSKIPKGIREVWK